MQIYRLSVPKEKLAAMPEDERAFLLLLGHAANEITVLQKLIIFCTNRQSENEIERRVEGAQAMLLTRLLIGKLNEGWEFVRTRMLSSKSVGMKYQAMLNPAGKNALEKLKQYFGRSNLLPEVRSRFAFHTPENSDVEAGFQSMPEAEPWDFYMADVRGNSFYLAADSVINFAIVNAIDATDPKGSLERMLDLALKVADALNDLIDAAIEAIFGHHFGPELTIEVIADMNPPDLSATTVPFFVDDRRRNLSPAA